MKHGSKQVKESHRGSEGPDQHWPSQGGQQRLHLGPRRGHREGHAPRGVPSGRAACPRDLEPHELLPHLRERVREHHREAAEQDQELGGGPKDSHAHPAPTLGGRHGLRARDLLRHEARHPHPQHV